MRSKQPRRIFNLTVNVIALHIVDVNVYVYLNKNDKQIILLQYPVLVIARIAELKACHLSSHLCYKHGFLLIYRMEGNFGGRKHWQIWRRTINLSKFLPPIVMCNIPKIYQ